MANWCSNMVVFEGKPEAITAIQELFQLMKEREEKTELGQLPEFIKDKNSGYLFNIYWNEGDEGQFEYETKWSPNIEIVQKIAEYYGVGFVQVYEELGNLIYGRATYRDNVLSDIFLSVDDFEAYEHNEEIDLYLFEEKEYESEYEILETLLKRKLLKS